MMMSKKKGRHAVVLPVKAKPDEFGLLIKEVRGLVQSARQAVASTVNTLQVLTNFEIGRRIVEHEQGGAHRAAYGQELLKKLAGDLSAKLGRGFSERNLEQMRRFYLTWAIPQTASAKSLPASDGPVWIPQTASATSPTATLLGGLPVFPLPWSH